MRTRLLQCFIFLALCAGMVAATPSGSSLYQLTWAKLKAVITGTASSSTFLRGDGTWASAGGGAAYTLTQNLTSPNALPSTVLNGGGVFARPTQLTTGQLTQLTGAIASGSLPFGVCVDPTGRFCYVAGYGSNLIYAFAITPIGSLSLIGSYSATSPYSIVCDPTGRYLYTTQFVSGGAIAQFSINSTTGALSSISGAVIPGGYAYSILCEPTGRFVYASSSTGSIFVYAIGSSGALASAGSTTSLSRYLACDPAGAFLYASGSSGIQAYTISQSTGLLTAVGSLISGILGPVIADGRFVFVAAGYSNSILAYSVSSTGSLTLQNSYTVANTGGSNFYLAEDPTRKYLYAAVPSSPSTVNQYSINQATGTLVTCGTLFASGLATDICVDPTGSFVYSTNYNSSGNVDQWAIGIPTFTNGTLSVGNMGTGTASNGTFLRGDGTWSAQIDGTLIGGPGGVEAARIDSTGLNLTTNSKAATFGSAGTVTAGVNQVVGTSSALVLNQSSSSNSIQLANNGHVMVSWYPGYLGALWVTQQFYTPAALTSGSTNNIMTLTGHHGFGYFNGNLGIYGVVRIDGTTVSVIAAQSSANYTVTSTPTAANYGINVSGSVLNLILGSSAADTISFNFQGT